MNIDYAYSEVESFDALPLFKAVFGHLIDPSITAIVCDLDELALYRGGLSDEHFCQSIPLQNLIHFQFRDSDESIQLMYKTIYKGRLTVFDYLEHRELELRSIQEIKVQLLELIPYLPPAFFMEFRLFGELGYLYEMHKNHFLMPHLTENQDEAKWALSRTTNQLIAYFSEGAQKSADAIGKRLLLKLKQSYIQSKNEQLSDNDVESLWDEIGKAVHEKNYRHLQGLVEMMKGDGKNIFYSLDENDQKMISLAFFNLDNFDLDECAKYDVEDFGQFYIFANFIEPIIEKLLQDSKDDWETKIFV